MCNASPFKQRASFLAPESPGEDGSRLLLKDLDMALAEGQRDGDYRTTLKTLKGLGASYSSVFGLRTLRVVDGRGPSVPP